MCQEVGHAFLDHKETLTVWVCMVPSNPESTSIQTHDYEELGITLAPSISRWPDSKHAERNFKHGPGQVSYHCRTAVGSELDTAVTAFICDR
jgi:hypothetical protein